MEMALFSRTLFRSFVADRNGSLTTETKTCANQFYKLRLQNNRQARGSSYPRHEKMHVLSIYKDVSSTVCTIVKILISEIQTQIFIFIR